METSNYFLKGEEQIRPISYGAGLQLNYQEMQKIIRCRFTLQGAGLLGEAVMTSQ